MKLLQLLGVILAATAVCGYQLYEDDVGQYDDEVNDVYDFMNRDIDERKNVPDEISAALKSLKRDEWEQIMKEDVNKDDHFRNSVQDPWGGRRRRRRRRRRRGWRLRRIRIRVRKVWRIYQRCCRSGLCPHKYCFG